MRLEPVRTLQIEQGMACCLGMRGWKKRAVTSFLRAEGMDARFFLSAASAIKNAQNSKGVLVVWASKASKELQAGCEKAGVPLYRMEDGFLRSRGLGAFHVQPTSLVLDRSGIYFDATAPSDLENMLERTDLSTSAISNAERLREMIVVSGLSKYNVGTRYDILDLPSDREIILVPGQVADDASLRFGCSTLDRNLDLLRATRREHPDAFIIYKPHPDVEAGKRVGFISPAVCLRYADHIASDMSSDAALVVVDHVVTMTSLIGFEALLRGKKVTCFGMPFYAGWGVTDDRVACPRRTRSRSVVEILAAAYVKYAKYIDPVTHESIDALTAAQLLLD